MSVELKKEKEGTRKPLENGEKFSLGGYCFSAFVLALFFAIIAASLAWFSGFITQLFITSYPEDNYNIVKHVATGLANPALGLVGVGLAVFFVIFGLFTVCAYSDSTKGDKQMHRAYKILFVTTVLLGISTVTIGGLWGTSKYAQAQAYNNSPTASCLSVNDQADYTDGKCVVVHNINVIDSIFPYSEKKETVKEINGKYVKGTEYTVVESGKSYGNTYNPNDKVFISDEELAARRKLLGVGDSAFTDYANNEHITSNSSYSSGNALGDYNKYVIHFTTKEYKVEVTEDIAPPKKSSVGSKIRFEGSDYTYINTASSSNTINENDMLVVRSDVLNK